MRTKIEVERVYKVEIDQADLSIIEARGYNLLLLIDKMIYLSVQGDEQEIHWIKSTDYNDEPYQGWVEAEAISQTSMDEILYTVTEWIVEEVGLKINGTFNPI